MEIAQKSQIHIKMVFPSSVCLSVSPMLVALSIYMSICVSIWVCPSVGLTVCSTIQLLENFENQWNKLTEIWPVTNQKPQIMPSQFKDLYIFSIVTISLFEFFSIAKMILNLFVVSVYVFFLCRFRCPNSSLAKKRRALLASRENGRPIDCPPELRWAPTIITNGWKWKRIMAQYLPRGTSQQRLLLY